MGIQVDIDKHEGLKIQRKHDPEIHKSADRARDIDDFLLLVDAAWEDYQNRLAIPRANWVPVKYMRPKEFVESPDSPAAVILFHVVSRKRHNTSRQKETPRRGRVPAIREQITDPDDDTNMLTLLSQKRDNMVEFQVWSPHSKKANEVALQFEGFMQAYDWYFTDKGINRVWFEERTEDKVEETGGTEWSVRTLQYLVITELIFKEVDKKLSKITIRFDTGSKLKTAVLDAETGLKEYSIDRGPSE
jgi:hypothetical protein